MADLIGDAVADPETFAHPDRQDALFAKLRGETPVRWTEPAGCRPFWLLSRHAEIVEVERQPDIFLNAPRTELLTRAEEDAMGGVHHSRTTLHMDGAEHRAYRGLTQAWFMPGNLRKLEGDLAALATEFVDRMEAMDGRCDFASDIAVWFPLRVIMTIFGIPPEEEPEILRLAHNLVGRKDKAAVGEAHADSLLIAAQEIFTYFGALYDDRKARPRDDLASVIAAAEVEGAPIGRHEALSYFLLIATAGHDTTSATMSGGLLALIRNPGLIEQLRADPSLLTPAVDEMLRWASPVKHFFRTAARDYDLAGQQIKAGDGLMVCFPSANRDETVFPDPFEFRLDRPQNKHLAFGHGAHLCLGQHLAKMEIKAFFAELLRRVDDVALAGEPRWQPVTLSGGLISLPIRYAMRTEVEAREPALV